MLLLIDNYDSFTFNIVQVLAKQGADVRVVRNDAATLDELVAMAPKQLVISPGPGGPRDAGISMAAISHFAGRIPVLGVCLGHQSLAAVFGGTVRRADRIMHGKTSPILHDGKTIFRDVPSPFDATRYHSLLVDRASLPASFVISAQTSEGEIMGLRHTPTGAEGVQFHPESILTIHGETLLGNFSRC